MEKTFRYKLDFYYLQALAYLLVMILYASVRGTFVEDKFEFVFRDPIVFVMIIFVLIAMVVLVLNRIRDRKLILQPNKIVFHNKFHERKIQIADIEWMYIGRERSVQTAGRSQIIIFKTKDRRTPYRIRLGRYERENELIAEMEGISERVPKKNGRPFGIRRKRNG